ncbi:MAG TPA: hypothetical protein VGM56_03160 [Byssovorax sp.]|jgi:hypothetical protein
MMRRFVNSLCASLVSAVVVASAVLTAGSAQAQEIQLTGPLAGAPAVRALREHRDGRFEFSPSVSFTLLDQYERTIMPGATATYHFADWIGVGVFGGFGIQYTTGLTDELQSKAIDGRACKANKGASQACQLTAVNLTQNNLSSDQLGHINWLIAPQVTVVPFRGKFALFSSFFVDTDVNIFAGPAIIGVQERADCGHDDSGKTLPLSCDDPKSFTLASRIAVAPTFGLGLNFYPSQFVGFGVDFRALPFSWNTSGFDNHGSGPNQDFPDNNVNSNDREFHFNSMLTFHVSLAFPTAVKLSP